MNVLCKKCAQGSVVIAELLYLSQHLPDAFKNLGDPNNKWTKILFNFKYFELQNDYDAKIDESTELFDLDNLFRDTHSEIISRFYNLFESIYLFHEDLTTFLDDLKNGVFIQQSLETLLYDIQGKQLIGESVYLLGVMLLLLDALFPGPIREAIIVAHFRYTGQTDIENLEKVTFLCKSSGFLPASFTKSTTIRPENYPENLFSRAPLDKRFLRMIIERLSSDDVYNQLREYPDPDHRTTAHATQAAMLYVVLYFAPEILHTRFPAMRAIVDKLFRDNWVISWFMGHTADLSIEWKNFKAASAAINNIVNENSVQSLLKFHCDSVPKLNSKLISVLSEGVLEDDYILDNVNDLLDLLRDSNVSIRWLLLHRTSSETVFQLRSRIDSTIPNSMIMALVLNTAQFEYRLKQVFKRLLGEKENTWNSTKSKVTDYLNDLSDYFSGTRALTRAKADTQLEKYFKKLSNKVAALDYSDPTTAGRRIHLLKNALVHVEQFHQIEGSSQIRTFIAETRELLQQMVRVVNIRTKVLVTLSIVSDLSYAWLILEDYVPLLQTRIKRDPDDVLKIRALFLKLQSILDLPLIRISQAGSPDLLSVSSFYSSELVNFVRKVLEIIPKTLFSILYQIIKLQTDSIPKLPMKIEKARILDFSKLPERFKLAKCTRDVALYTQAILAMEKTLVGVIEVDPGQLLEDGIRKELVSVISETLYTNLKFNHEENDQLTPRSSSKKSKRKNVETNPLQTKLSLFEKQLKTVGSRLDGIKRSFEYLSDYVNLYGLKIWQQEYSRIINYNVEQECNKFLKTQVLDIFSKYQSDHIPIPRYPAINPTSQTFIGSITRELLTLTSCRDSIYIPMTQAWVDPSNGVEIVNINTISSILDSIGVNGLIGMDKLISFMIVKEIAMFLEYYNKKIRPAMFAKAGIDPNNLNNSTSGGNTHTSEYDGGSIHFVDSLPDLDDRAITRIVSTLVRIGGAQLIRKHIAKVLEVRCKLDSPLLYSALQSTNASLLADIEAHYTDPQTKQMPPNELLASVGKLLESAGLHDPFAKIYITTPPRPAISAVLIRVVASQMKYLTFYPQYATLILSKYASGFNSKSNSSNADLEPPEPLDGMPFVVGTFTLLHQFNSAQIEWFFSHGGKLISRVVNTIVDPSSSTFTKTEPPTSSRSKKKGTPATPLWPVLPSKVASLSHFFNLFIQIGALPQRLLSKYVPPLPP